ncbi:MAG TPA: AMP-binding protein [Streptosporangiaceae bacterium]|nr:AMP-binding protein [Streptosporangiaceae bacterium]
MERGVSTGERTKAGPLRPSAGSPDRAVTGHILEVADEAGYRAALIDATDGSVTPWPRFASTVRAAADGLARRGLAEGDTASVFVHDAASAAIAVNAIRAAGARACLIRSDASPADIAARLNACGARVLITSAPLAELATEGADRSRVRQVIAFGEAAGTTPFSSLLSSGRHGQPEEHAAGEPGFPTRPGFTHESGRPEGNGLTHERDLADPGEPGSGRGLTYRDMVVACPPCGGGQAYISYLDVTLLTGATLVAAPLPLMQAAIRVYKGSAAIVPEGTGVPGLTPARIYPVA